MCCCVPYTKLSKSQSQEHFELVQQLGFDVTYDDVHAEFEKLRLRQGRLLVYIISHSTLVLFNLKLTKTILAFSIALSYILVLFF